MLPHSFQVVVPRVTAQLPWYPCRIDGYSACSTSSVQKNHISLSLLSHLSNELEVEQTCNLSFQCGTLPPEGNTGLRSKAKCSLPDAGCMRYVCGNTVKTRLSSRGLICQKPSYGWGLIRRGVYSKGASGSMRYVCGNICEKYTGHK